jgi:hypothetical protein
MLSALQRYEKSEERLWVELNEVMLKSDSIAKEIQKANAELESVVQTARRPSRRQTPSTAFGSANGIKKVC